MKKAYVIVGGNDPTYDSLKEAEAAAEKFIQDEGVGPLFVAEVRLALWAERKFKMFREEVKGS